MKKTLLLTCLSLFTVFACKQKDSIEMSNISQETIAKAIDAVSDRVYDNTLANKGISQAASLWRVEDGTPEDFIEFVSANIMPDEQSRRLLFNKLSTAFEAIYGASNQLTVDLLLPVHLSGGELTDID